MAILALHFFVTNYLNKTLLQSRCFFFLFIIFISKFASSLSVTTETQALVEFKRNLIDPLNVLDSWQLETQSPCNFYGVTCDEVTKNVTEISLVASNLSGSISPTISLLRNLRILNLTGNELLGVIPDLSSMQNLQKLDLSTNYFSGSFPVWVGNLTSLTRLSLGQNYYDESRIPYSIGNLKNLVYLYLANSNFKGQIPTSLFEIHDLETLDLSTNNISGEFPKDIVRLKKLIKIELFVNQLTGQIPDGIANLTLLSDFDVSNNQLSGKLPAVLGQMTNLSVFHLYDNNFSGEIPRGFGDMRNLVSFSIYRNNFSGKFPINFGRFSPLSSIDISENQFSGPFPKFLCAGGRLLYLLALSNNFSGYLPGSYSHCKTVERLRINKNGMSGKIPDGVWALPFTTIIDFGDNEFTGGISSDIRLSCKLNQLVLHNNRFSGEVPVQLGDLNNLERIHLSNNYFSGDIPSQFANLKHLSSLHLEDNNFSGPIPPELGSCNRLVELNLARNSLVGKIPKTISLMSSLNSINLSRNKLTGMIPESLVMLKLSSIDMSYNELSGRVASDLVRIGGERSFYGNKGLCVDPNYYSFEVRNTTIISSCVSDPKVRRGFKDKIVLLCILGSVLVALVAGLLVSYRNVKCGKTLFGHDTKSKLTCFHQFEIDADQIHNLDENNLIGCGATGKVYRLHLKKKCTSVAVKQLWKVDRMKVLKTEMDILGKIRHRNILKLLACLVEQGSSFLVLEYMENGNLFEALSTKIKGVLDWNRRYRIALQVANAIAYLHHDCLPPIIHGDIKSTNILLDADYDPKIADFGAAKFAESSSSSSYLRAATDNSCLAAGTHGYIAPEFGYTAKVTTKSDVYSFGVVLLELITGQNAIKEEYGEGKDIVEWVLTHLNTPENIIKLLDPQVVTEFVKDNMIKILKVAVLCTNTLPNKRPSMREVAKMLADANPGRTTYPLTCGKINCSIPMAGANQD